MCLINCNKVSAIVVQHKIEKYFITSVVYVFFYLQNLIITNVYLLCSY